MMPATVTPRIIGNAWASAESLCRYLIAPELDEFEAQFYLLLESFMPTTLGATVRGYTHPHLDLALQERIEKQQMLGGWRGRGPAIVVNDRLLSEESPSPADFRLAFHSVAIHELAHVVERIPVIPEVEPLPEVVELVQGMVDNEIYIIPEKRKKPRPPFFLHDARFFRALLHLRYRAWCAGFVALVTVGHDFANHGLSDVLDYQTALGNEPFDLKDIPVSDVMALDPPQAFIDLFRRDCERWRNHRSEAIEKGSDHDNADSSTGVYRGPGDTNQDGGTQVAACN